MSSGRPPALRYYLDEHLPPIVAARLRARGIDAIAAADAGRAAQAITDEDQLAFAAANGRTLVTHDRDFIALSAACTPHAGVLLLQNQLSIGQTIEFLELFAAVTPPDDVHNQLRFCDW